MPLMAMPAKSRPGVRGRVVFLKRPATFPMSLGLMAAAFTCTSTSPAPGSGIATSSILKTDGGPNSVKRNDFIMLVLMALQFRNSNGSAYLQDISVSFKELHA